MLINLEELIDEIGKQENDYLQDVEQIIEQISFENYLHKCSYCLKWENSNCAEKSLPNNCSWDGIMLMTDEDKIRDREQIIKYMEENK